MGKLKLGDTIAYDETMIAYQLMPQDFSRFVGQLVLMDDDAVGEEEPSWLEVVQLKEYHDNGDVSVATNENDENWRIPKYKLVKHSGNYVAFYAIKPEVLNAPEVPPETVPESEVIVSEEYKEAKVIHNRIMANKQILETTVFELGRDLKTMRDGKLYKQFGYSNFEDYCQNEVKFTRRQAYKYLTIAERLPEDFVNSCSQIGVTKLSVIAMLDEPDRQALMETHDVENMTVKELKEAKAEIKKLKDERAEMIEHHVAEQGDFLRKIDQLQGRVQQLESRPAEVYKDEKDQAEIERLTAENNQLKIENEALEEQRDELEGKLFTMENDCQEGAVSDAEEKRFAEFTSAMNQQLVEETHRIHEEAQEEISRANLQRDNAFAEVAKLREQLALAQKPAVQESLSGSDGEFDAYFRMFDDALKHMTTYLFRKDCTDFLRRQSISMMETKFEKYISALKEERK